MGRHRRGNCRSHWAFTNQRLYFRILHSRLMNLNMSVMILMNKRFQWFAIQNIHVF